MKSDKILEDLMHSPAVKNLGIRKEAVSGIIDSYNDIVINSLLDNGHVELDTGMNIEVVKLIDRVHVLRGVSYMSNRKYKLKLTMEDILYKRISDYYKALEEDIL